jgi:cytochrome P450
VVVSPYLLHRNPRHWEEPETFRPERFLGEEKPSSQVFLPFGGGTKSCPGSTVALLLLEGAIRALATGCSLRARSAKLPRPEPTYALIPETPVTLTVEAPAGAMG